MTVPAVVRRLNSKLDIDSLASEAAPLSLQANEIGQVTLRTVVPLPLDDYADNRRTGSFLLIDRADGMTLDAGMVTLADVALAPGELP
jgi:sulfate adenylyltransferase subunit 1